MRRIAILALLASLGACAGLPADGPSGDSITKQNGVEKAGLTYSLVDLDYALSQRLLLAPAVADSSLAALENSTTADTINVGDELQVSIFDPNGGVFSSRPGPTSANGPSVQSSNQTLPALMVDRDGTIVIPFAGVVNVRGMTTRQASDAIRRSLAGRVANPQVLVAVASSPANGIVVLGEVRSPGRASVRPGAENLLDAIAAAGGPNRNIDDIRVTVNRAGTTYDAPLRKVLSDFDQNIRLKRGDQVNLVYAPRRYSSFGALGKVSQFEMPSGTLTLTGALGQLGGLDPTTANAHSVLVFRFERPDAAQLAGVTLAPTPKGVPIIYRLDLQSPTGFFIANSFEIRPDDVIFVPRSRVTEMRTFFEFVRSITGIIYDVSVTSTLTVD
jgi:polysaccharide export outer membrane protein